MCPPTWQNTYLIFARHISQRVFIKPPIKVSNRITIQCRQQFPFQVRTSRLQLLECYCGFWRQGCELAMDLTRLLAVLHSLSYNFLTVQRYSMRTFAFQIFSKGFRLMKVLPRLVCRNRWIFYIVYQLPLAFTTIVFLPIAFKNLHITFFAIVRLIFDHFEGWTVQLRIHQFQCQPLITPRKQFRQHPLPSCPLFLRCSPTAAGRINRAMLFFIVELYIFEFEFIFQKAGTCTTSTARRWSQRATLEHPFQRVPSANSWGTPRKPKLARVVATYHLARVHQVQRMFSRTTPVLRGCS